MTLEEDDKIICDVKEIDEKINTLQKNIDRILEVGGTPGIILYDEMKNLYKDRRALEELKS